MSVNLNYKKLWPCIFSSGTLLVLQFAVEVSHHNFVMVMKTNTGIVQLYMYLNSNYNIVFSSQLVLKHFLSQKNRSKFVHPMRNQSHVLNREITVQKYSSETVMFNPKSQLN